jgi:hypothetical protein
MIAMAAPIQLTVSASPFINAIAMDMRGLNSAEIGAIRTMEILATASLLIWLSARIQTFSPRILGLLGLGLFMTGNLLSLAPGADALAEAPRSAGDSASVLAGHAGLVAGRIIAGAGAGCLGAAWPPLLALLPSPHRAAALMAAPITVGAILSAFLTSQGAEAGSALGVFGFLAAGALVALSGVLLAPSGRPQAHAAPAIGSMVAALRHPWVLGSATIYFGSTGVYHFLAQIGATHALSAAAVGSIVVAVAVACIVSTPLAALVRDRSVRPVFLVAVALFGVGSSSIALSPNAAVYAFGFWLQSAAFGFYAVLGAAVAVRLDATGGLAAAGAGWQAFGNAFSPFVAGLLILGGSFAPLGALCIASSLVTLALFARASAKLPPPAATR